MERADGQQLWDSNWARRVRIPSPGPGLRRYLCAGAPKEIYSVGLLGAKNGNSGIKGNRQLSVIALSRAVAYCIDQAHSVPNNRGMRRALGM